MEQANKQVLDTTKALAVWDALNQKKDRALQVLEAWVPNLTSIDIKEGRKAIARLGAQIFRNYYSELYESIPLDKREELDKVGEILLKSTRAIVSTKHKETRLEAMFLEDWSMWGVEWRLSKVETLKYDPRSTEEVKTHIRLAATEDWNERMSFSFNYELEKHSRFEVLANALRKKDKERKMERINESALKAEEQILAVLGEKMPVVAAV